MGNVMKNGDGFIRPYGDSPNDGLVQMCFTLPIGRELAPEAARSLALQMGLAQPQTVYCQDIGEGFTFIILYGRCTQSVEIATINTDRAVDVDMSFEEINRLIKKKIRRKISVIGACIESDAHTVGIDAMLNMKGYQGNYGLERYSEFEVVNMGAQVPSEELIIKAKEVNADAILVSQVVTQQNIHMHNLTKLIDLLEAENLRDNFFLIVGGPSIDNKLAKELGYDAGFGRGTIPSDVATYIVKRLVDKGEKA